MFRGYDNVVSILVFMECARRVKLRIGSKATSRFQSLFLWNALVEAVGTADRSEAFLVSILVFMECARRAGTTYTTAAILMFQSLFLWNALVEPAPQMFA